MALELGGVNFSVEANTEGMRNALAAMQRFEKEVNKVARTQQKGSSQAVSAMAKQESAMKKGFQQAAKLRAELVKAGANANQLSKVTAATKSLTTALSKGEVSTLKFTRAQDAFNAKMAQSRGVLSQLKAEVGGTNKKVNRFTKSMRDLESASVLVVGPLSGIGARIRSLGAIFSRETVGIALAIGAFTAMVAGLGKLAASSVRAGVEFEKSMARFRAASKSPEQAAKNMLFVIETSEELALAIRDNVKAYSRLTAAAQGTSLEGKGVEKVFKGVATAAAALRLDVVEVEGIFRALEQMISKGSVQAEELRGQLGERLPGAFNRAAKAMGVTTSALSDMLKAGEVLPEELLPKLAEILEDDFGAAAANNIHSFTGAINNLRNEWFLLGVEFDNVSKLSVLVARAANGLAGALKLLRENVDVIAKGLGVLAGVSTGLVASWAILFGATMVKNIIKTVAGLGLLTKVAAALNIVASKNPYIALAKGILWLGTAVGGATAGFMIMDGIMRDMDSVMEDLAKQAALAGDDIEGAFSGRTSDAMRDFLRQLEDMETRIAAMSRGASDLEEFERIAIPVREFARALQDAGIQGEEAQKLLNRFVNANRALVDAEDALHDAAQRSGNAIVNSLEDAIFSANSFKDVLKDLGLELIKVGFRAAIFDPLAKGLGTFFSKNVNLPTLPGKAAGGPVTGGNPYIVGENGPEIFRPNVNGSIIPNGGGGGGISITINAPGADAGTVARIREMVQVELAPQIIRTAVRSTTETYRRPRFA